MRCFPLLLAAIAPANLWAGPPLTSLRYAPDTTTVLSGTTVGPGNVAADDLQGSVSLLSIGAIPAGAHLDGYAVTGTGGQLLSFDTAVVLGAIAFRRNDIVRFEGSTYTLEFSGSAQGVPEGTDIRDFALNGPTNLVMAFDTTVSVSGLTVTPRDLVQWNGSAFSSFFVGATAGVPPELAIDGVHLLPGGDVLLSFDGSGTVAGVSFDDEDVLQHTTPATWALAYDGSGQQVSGGWRTANLTALEGSPSAVPVDLFEFVLE